MENISENINKFLPFGETLRTILQHPSIKNTDLKYLLRLKGIFLDNIDDDSTFPFLTTCLLSPFEFEVVKERLQTREDREKTITRTLEWHSQVNLINAIPDNFNIQEVVKTTFPRYKIVGSPNFAMVENNPNRITLNFKCESENYSKEWYRAKNEFKGQVTLEKVVHNNKVQLQIVHTSPETTDISDKVVKTLERHFKSNGCMNANSQIDRILYKNFSNEDRIKFFLSLTEGNDVFEFQKASNLDIGPDPSQSLPENISWMELAKVKELNINGEDLHKIVFFNDATLHQYLELCEMEILYNFTLPFAEGNCKIGVGFRGYFNKRISSIEFVVDIIKINLKDEFSHVQLANVHKSLTKEFEKFKNEKYDWIKLTNLSNQYTPQL